MGIKQNKKLEGIDFGFDGKYLTVRVYYGRGYVPTTMTLLGRDNEGNTTKTKYSQNIYEKPDEYICKIKMKKVR